MQRGNITSRIESLYSEGLQRHLAGGGEEALRSAYEAGRIALSENLGLLDMAGLHHRALARILAAAQPDEVETICNAAAGFFVESLAPHEMAIRGYREAITALRFLNETLETEIKRIAHTVHDEAGQLLVTVHLAIAEIAKDVPLALQIRLGDVSDLLGQVEKQLRQLSHELRPTVLDDLGLIPAVRLLADRVSKRAGLSIWVEATHDGRLLPVMETALYRIIQEALNNVVKHAVARNIWIQIHEDEWKVCCSIRDDGAGFDTNTTLSGKGQKGLGLIGIRERLSAIGGTLQIKSAPGRGTELLIAVPRQKARAEREQDLLIVLASSEDGGVSSSSSCR